MKIPLTFLFLPVAFCLSQAGESERGFTLDLARSDKTQDLPVWMTGSPLASPADHATIGFTISPPPGNSDLAVTFYFQETEGGFLRVYWDGTQTNEMLSDNLFEGIAMPNQRTLLIKRETLSSPGTLSVQSSEPALNVSRIHWEWVDPTTVDLAKGAEPTALVDANGRIFKETEINGAPSVPPPDRLRQSIVTAELTQKPERIESGVEFVATLQAVPEFARLEVRISGAALDKAVQLFVNGKLTGEVALEIPDLSDPGYQTGSDGAAFYVGWRKGVVYVPVGQLATGENRFQFGIKDGAAAAAAPPLAVKNLILQLKYEGKPANVMPSTPQFRIPLSLRGNE